MQHSILQLPSSVALRCLKTLLLHKLSHLPIFATACSAFCKFANDPQLYHALQFNNHTDDLHNVLGLLSHKRFSQLRTLHLGGLNCVRTKLINSVRYRRGLPVPQFARLQHLWLINGGHKAQGTLSLAAHIISILPPTLLSFSFGRSIVKWISLTNIETLALRCPQLQALDLSFSKASAPWSEVLRTLASKLPMLRGIDIEFAGGCDDSVRSHKEIEDLLLPLQQLKHLWFLGIGNLGLAGGKSYLNTNGPPAALNQLLQTLSELRVLDAFSRDRALTDTETATQTDFKKAARMQHPDLFVTAYSRGYHREDTLFGWLKDGGHWLGDRNSVAEWTQDQGSGRWVRRTVIGMAKRSVNPPCNVPCTTRTGMIKNNLLDAWCLKPTEL